jgi:hypothetical protein
MWLLFTQLRAFCEWSPLQPGRAATITMQWRAGAPSEEPPVLELPQGFVAESPPVRVPAMRQVSWRVRAVAPASDRIRFIAGQDSVVKTISAGAGPSYLSRRRSGLTDLVFWPNEAPISRSDIDWIEIQYPDSDGAWMLWLFAGSVITALALRRRFRVEF